MKVPVLEIFGPTFQGEGAVIGQKTMFIRTAGCDFRCSWCDSKFTWDGSQKDRIQMLTSEEIFNQLDVLAKDNYNHVTISGGNPLLIQGLETFVYEAKQRGIKLAVETQGTKFQKWLKNIDEVTISPKPPSSQMETDFEKLEFMMNQLKRGQYNLKVVVFNDKDLQYAKHIHLKYKGVPFYIQVGNPYLSDHVPNHTEKLLERYEHLVDDVMADNELLNVRVLPQLHTILWSNKQGV